MELALDTTKAGEFTGRIAVRLNATSVHVTVSASVKRYRASLLRLLVVETPFQKFSTSDGGHFRQWTDLVADAPWDVNYLLAHRDSSAGRKTFSGLAMLVPPGPAVSRSGPDTLL